MDDRQFDSFARSLASGLSRRRVMAGFAAGAGSWMAPFSNRTTAAQSESAAGSERCRGECRPLCPRGTVCEPDGCYCVHEWLKDRDGIVYIQADTDGRVVAAYAPGTPGIGLTVNEVCAAETCTSTLVVQEDGASAPTLVATAESSTSGAIELRIVGEGVDYQIAADQQTATIESTSLGRPPILGTFDPSTGQIVGDWVCNDVPMPFAEKLELVAPALHAIAGSSDVSSASVYCPPGAPGPTNPFPPDPAPQAPLANCYTACDVMVGVLDALCCAETLLVGCLGCIALGAITNNICHGTCDSKFGSATLATSPDATVTSGGEPPPTATPEPGNTGSDGSGTAVPDAETDTPTPEPTPSLPCSPGERACQDRCIPDAECPVSECCLDPQTCACACPDCLPNFAFDPATCDCVCALQCPPNFVFDEANCACICTAECPPTFVFDEATCSCLCELTDCPPNFTFTPESCACFCEPPVCPPGHFVDQASCSCFCPEAACGEGQVFDPGVCACVGAGAGSGAEPLAP